MVVGSVIGDAFVDAAPTAGGTITGTMYRDYNDNGVRNTAGSEAIDGPLASVAVSATCVSDAGADATVGTADDLYGPLVTTASSATGAYTLTVTGSPCRVEAVAPVNSEPSAIGTGNGSTVRFVTAATTGVDFGFFTPGEYCQSTPKLVTNCFVGGNGAAYPYTGIETEPLRWERPTATTATRTTPRT